MSNFIALYRGDTIGSAKLLAVSGNPDLVTFIAEELLADPIYAPDINEDPALSAINLGRRRALELIKGGKEDSLA